MKSNRDYIKEKEYQDIESLLNRTIFEEVDEFFGDVSSKDDLDLIEIDDSCPGSYQVDLDVMNMNAHLEINCPDNCRCNFTLEDVYKLIKSYGPNLTVKVNWDLVNDYFDRTVNRHEELKPVIIAKGTPVEPYVPEYILLKESLNPTYRPTEQKDGRVDYHNIKAFIYVKEGEMLGTLIPERKGSSGVSLMGKIIPHPTIVENNLKFEKNIRVEKGVLYSLIDGTFKIVKDKIKIEECLEVETDVDYNTGDIDYIGDVHISGSIREGFNVSSGGDIFVNRSIEASIINCGNSLYVNEGIIGSDKSSVFCDGGLSAKHIENSLIKSHGTIRVKNSILKSQIFSLDKVIVPKGGSVVGGVVYAQNGMSFFDVGNKSGIDTELILGLDYEAVNKLRTVRDTIDQLIVKMAELQEELPYVKSREDKEQIKSMFLSLKSRVDKLHNYSQIILRNIDRNDNAKLEVFGTIYPGTYIEICHISLKVKDTLHRVVFSLNKDEGEIAIEYMHK